MLIIKTGTVSNRSLQSSEKDNFFLPSPYEGEGSGVGLNKETSMTTTKKEAQSKKQTNDVNVIEFLRRYNSEMDAWLRPDPRYTGSRRQS